MCLQKCLYGLVGKDCLVSAAEETWADPITSAKCRQPCLHSLLIPQKHWGISLSLAPCFYWLRWVAQEKVWESYQQRRLWRRRPDVQSPRPIPNEKTWAVANDQDLPQAAAVDERPEETKIERIAPTGRRGGQVQYYEAHGARAGKDHPRERRTLEWEKEHSEHDWGREGSEGKKEPGEGRGAKQTQPHHQSDWIPHRQSLHPPKNTEKNVQLKEPTDYPDLYFNYFAIVNPYIVNFLLKYLIILETTQPFHGYLLHNCLHTDVITTLTNVPQEDKVK